MTALAFRRDSKPDFVQEDFARHRGSLPGAGLAWLDTRRRAAMDAFAATGIPTRRVEAWKYTDLANALESELEPATPFSGDLDEENAFAASDAHLLLVNGFLHRTRPVDGLDIVDLGALDADAPDWVKESLGLMAAGRDSPLGAASLALMRGGVAVRVREHATLHVDFLTPPHDRGAVSHCRVLLVLEEGARLSLLETHRGEGVHQTLANIGMELVLKPGARLEHVRLQAEASKALHVTSLGARLEREAEYRALYAALGAQLSRLDVNVQLAAPGAHATLHNVAVLNAGIADVTTVMDHATPHGTSRQLFKSVVGGRGRSVNQGRVVVREGAVKSDSHQLFKALLLSPRAEADAKPELEIFADDV
ncbi:MAG TPA: SufD family Fe-S cluster assembly protein, partial [Micropepsaceae bacterium]|nr:SufD family Fe-S cluster assembly protein [Micropepsaceae bacterium]